MTVYGAWPVYPQAIIADQVNFEHRDRTGIQSTDMHREQHIFGHAK